MRHGGTTAGVLFYIIFELTSAFGNVGLSLGSLRRPNSPASFSRDLNAMCLLIVCLVQVAGRTRDMPAMVDSALSLPTIDTEDVLRASQTYRPDNLAAVDDAPTEDDRDEANAGQLEDDTARDAESDRNDSRLEPDPPALPQHDV